ncbi:MULTISPECIES: Rv0361 family membrane protein [Mycolicibacterium]|uniref:DUF8174 domain-containing protein n=2 Tax=Mycolicibacterium TaxID=1866885 RepID=A0A9X2Y5N4_9MYCO|nr:MULTISPECIES: hypothetical protein [Mycolicibacterium]MCV7168382.1 hypothetical protein [[Mycobacterium] manitobense]MDO3639688.1 hypothetical protein [Mycolicibacterium arseniciresistens]
MAGPHQYPESFPQHPQGPHPQQHQHPYRPEPQQEAPALPYPENVPSAYPGMLPPPVQYPKRRRPWRAVLAAAVGLLVVIAVVVGVVLATRGGDDADQGALTPATAQAAIQDYLDALADGDDETVARHTLCGLFDGIKQRRSDLALAGLAGDAFRKQFDRAEVSSIDTIVPLSNYQAQVLFTMRVTPAGGPRRGGSQQEEDEQAVAQVLERGDDVFVCSYLLRSGGQY